jgi:hypothetical protein
MRNALVRLLTVLIGIQPALLYAQADQPQPAPTSNPQASGSATRTPGVDYDLLSASLARLRRELAEQPPSKSFTPLKLNFYVEVVAEAPPIQFFTPQDFAAGGPVPWAPPTHREMLDVMTPQEFRSPLMPIGSMLLMGIKQLFQWEAEKAKRQREAEKRQREEEQRKKLIFGAPVPPPK